MAQFYTNQVCKQVGGRIPGATGAFIQLLTVQSPTYHDFAGWLNGSDGPAGEIVRSAMIEYRTADSRPHDEFEAMLQQAGDRLQRTRRQHSLF